MTAAPDPGVTTTLTSSEGSAPTLPSFTGVVRDVEVSEHYSRTSPDAVEFTAQPQALGTLSVGLVAGAVYLSAEYMGDKVVLDDPTLAAAHLGYMVGPEVQGTSMTAVYAVTSNPDAVRMRVTCTDGTRFLS